MVNSADGILNLFLEILDGYFFLGFGKPIVDFLQINFGFLDPRFGLLASLTRVLWNLLSF